MTKQGNRLGTYSGATRPLAKALCTVSSGILGTLRYQIVFHNLSTIYIIQQKYIYIYIFGSFYGDKNIKDSLFFKKFC